MIDSKISAVFCFNSLASVDASLNARRLFGVPRLLDDLENIGLTDSCHGIASILYFLYLSHLHDFPLQSCLIVF